MNVKIILYFIVAIIIGIAPFAILYYQKYLSRKAKIEIEEELNILLSELNKTGFKVVPRGKVELKGKAAWIWGVTISELGAEKVVSLARMHEIKHLFILVKGVSGVIVKDVIKNILPLAHSNGIYVHAWFVCFVDRSSASPSPDNPEYRLYLLRVISEFLLLNSSSHFIDGVHLDYVRFSGYASDKTEYITSFVASVKKLIDTIAPGAILSIASKAENYSTKSGLVNSAKFYGQDYVALSNYVDLFCPMTYYLDYGVSPYEAMLANKWIKELTNKSVFAGIQCHACERDPSRKPKAEELIEQLQLVKEFNLDGACFFRFGSIIDFDLWRAIDSVDLDP